MNNVILLGRLTKDPDLRVLDNGTSVATFNLAVDRGKDKDGNDMGADFPQITVWGRQAELCDRYLSKGSQCAVQGRIRTGSYEKDGRKIYTTDIKADRVEFLGGKKKEAKEEQVEGFTPLADDEIPF